MNDIECLRPLKRHYILPHVSEKIRITKICQIRTTRIGEFYKV